MPLPIFGDVAIASNIIPAIVGAGRFRSLHKSMKVLTLLCILACLQEGGEIVLAVIRHTNYFLSDYYRVIEVSMLCAVFYYSVDSKQGRWRLSVLGIVFAVAWGVDLALFSDPNRINSLMSMVARSFMMVMAAIALWTQLKDEQNPILEQSVFWVAASVILYSAGTMVVLGLSNVLMQLGRPYFLAAWHINWVLLITANILYTKGILCKARA